MVAGMAARRPSAVASSASAIPGATTARFVDSDAAIAAEGLLGGNYISVTPGGSDIMLAPGEEIMFTQGSVDFMDLVGRAISSSGSTSQ